MRRRTIELAVVLVAAMGVEAREASLRARDAIYCAPIRAGNSTERFLRGVEMTRVGLGAGGGTRVPPLQIKGGAPADGALKGRRYTDGEMNSPLQGPAGKFRTEEGNYVAKNFKFRDGEAIGELRLHYATLGKPVRDAAGRITNAVMLLHGTGGSGAQFLAAQFAGELFGAGQLLDTAKYYIILPDGIGHGKSSKPSDGLHAKFPQYDYDDMVAGHHALLEHLGVEHLRLILGTAPLLMQKTLPTRDAADKYLDEYFAARMPGLDANDLLYAVSASRNYDPSPGLEKIRARMMYVNSADDFINPPELGIAEREIRRVAGARFVLIPVSDATHGHGTHTWAAVWKGYLAELLTGK